MADVIQLLPDSVANQIAAGEVVQRPASVVKELMENALDASATHLRVAVKNAGKTAIHVVDDGVGMSDTDARLSIERHATSKVRKAQDLFALQTMGFRGEALAAIAAIAQVEIKTCRADHTLGSHLTVEGAQAIRQEQIPHRKGTSVEVKNLFFNVPARRAFLKSNAVEMRHITEEFQRLAIAHSDKSFTLKNDTQTLHELSASKLGKRIADLFGESQRQKLVSCREETASLRITGYVGHPETARKTRGGQYLFVNRRYVKNNYLNHAVASAFEGLIAQGSYPFFVLFIKIDPSQIDVNVHPTKTEINFEDARAIYTIMKATVKKALGLNQLIPSIDFKSDVNLSQKVDATPQRHARAYLDEHAPGFRPTRQKGASTWPSIFPPSERADAPGAPLKKTVQRDSAVNREEITPPVARGAMQLHHRYILREVQDGLLLIDQQAAHERMLYERHLAALKKGNGESQQALFPKTVQFTPADFALFTAMEKDVKALGFRFEEFGENAVLVSGTPAHAPHGDEKDLVEGLLEQYKENRDALSLPRRENLAWSLARKASIKRGRPLSSEEIDALIKNLFSRNITNVSSTGKPIFVVLDMPKIERFFNL